MKLLSVIRSTVSTVSTPFLKLLQHAKDATTSWKVYGVNFFLSGIFPAILHGEVYKALIKVPHFVYLI
jgi:hypothetical protein